MLAATSLHRHQPVIPERQECTQCAHHEAHPGHLTQGVTSIHDCLICQLTTVPYAQSSEAHISAQISICTTLIETYICSGEGLHLQNAPLRGPPAIG